MNNLEHDTNGTLVETMPLFESSLLALFYVLRKRFNDRRIQAEKATSSSTKGKNH